MMKRAAKPIFCERVAQVRGVHLYIKKGPMKMTCPICGTHATDIYKEQRLDNTLNENGLHKVFLTRASL